MKIQIDIMQNYINSYSMILILHRMKAVYNCSIIALEHVQSITCQKFSLYEAIKCEFLDNFDMLLNETIKTFH